jgi:alkaline phosphatase D
VKFFNGRRGYVNTVIGPDEMRVDFRSLPYVTEPFALPYTSGRFVIEDRNPHLNPA